LGKRIWLGLMVTANPRDFKCLSAYLRFCGRISDVIKSHKYNRHARMLYHMLAEGIMKQKDARFRPVYDKCKTDIAEKYPDYTKLHIHNAALNRTATFLAKEIFNHCRAGDESSTLTKSIFALQSPAKGNRVEHITEQVRDKSCNKLPDPIPPSRANNKCSQDGARPGACHSTLK